jgi:glycosyltransferase involved in cell wall biosynthesis
MINNPDSRDASLPNSRRSTRVLFLAWGFSIHAKRRIEVFLNDPSFKVAVASTHAYEFENAFNILLDGIHHGEADQEGCHEKASTHLRDKMKKWFHMARHLLDPRLFIKIHRILSVEGTALSFDHLKILLSIFLLPRLRYRLLGDLALLSSSIQKFSPDVIFLQTLIYPSYLALLLPASVPLAITFWNGDILWWARWDGIEQLAKKHLVTYGVRNAQAITVNSLQAYRICQGYGVEDDKIHLIRYPGTDLDLFRPLDKGHARTKLKIDSPHVVLSPRGLGEYLNTEVIVQAAAQVLKTQGDTLFIFLSGSEDEIRRHKDLAQTLGIASKCRWEGPVSWEAMPLYYNAADVMVSISSQDSLPNCMLEAMACGTPVIMGDIPPVREWVDDEKNGFLVSPSDPAALSRRLLQLLHDNGKYGREFSTRNIPLIASVFDARKNTDQVKDLVHRLASNHLSST